MKVLLTGANGFLGKKVVKNLINQGHSVRALVIPEEDTTYLASLTNIEIVRGDLTEPETIKYICNNIDTVVHLAAILNVADEKLNFKINYEATKNIADVAEEARVKNFIFTSSMSTTSKNPNPYGLSKKKAEDYLLQRSFKTTIFRPTLLYGKEGFAFQKMVEMINILPVIVPVIGKGMAKKQPIYVDDAALIISNAAIKKEGKIYSLGGPEAVPFKVLMKKILIAQNKKKIFIHAPKWIVWTALIFIEKVMKDFPVTRDKIIEMETSTEIDHKLIEREFDIKLTSLEDGLKKSL